MADLIASPPAAVAPDSDPASVTLDYLLQRMRHKSDFPALSESVSRVQALSDAENESLARLCDEILKDVALTQKLLRVVNTAHFRRAGSDPISTVSRAVALVGVGGIRNIALSLMLVEHMEDRQHAQHLKVEFLRAVMAGTLASELCAGGREAEQLYLEALFRNLGRLLVGFYLPEDAQEIRDLVKGQDPEPPLPEPEAVMRVLGVGFEPLGAAVGRTWGLPGPLLDHMVSPTGDVPQRSLAARPERSVWLTTLANQAAQAMLQQEPTTLGDALQALNQRYQVPLDLKPQAVQDAAARARKRLTEMTQVLNFSVPADSPAGRLLETFYVDAPNAGDADRGPSPEALGLAAPGEDGALSVPSVPPAATTSADVLTRGIQDITSTLVDSFRLNDVLGMILETVYVAFDCRRVIFCLRDARSGSLVGRIGLGQGADALKSAFQIPLQWRPGEVPDLFSAVCLKGVDTLIADARAPSVAGRLPPWFAQRVQAPTFLLLPLSMKRQGQDVVLGVIYADRDSPDSLTLTDKDLSLLRTLRAQAVMAFKQSSPAGS